MRDFLFLKINAKCAKISFNDLQYIEAVDKYARFVTVNQIYLVLGCLYHVEEQLPTDQFCRIHRSYIVSFRHIIEFNHELVSIAGKELPLGKQSRPNFYDKAQIVCADGNTISTPSDKEITIYKNSRRA
jgi:two-component system LytT family response regulator